MLSKTQSWNQWSSRSRFNDTWERDVHSNVCGTEFRQARYSRFGAASRQPRRASRSNTLSARVSDRMAGENWAWRGKAALNVSRFRGFRCAEERAFLQRAIATVVLEPVLYHPDREVFECGHLKVTRGEQAVKVVHAIAVDLDV
jgi:hypothetical protein